ncbi:MAG: endonuclease/exonuclease/phosphatase family protein [Thermaurantimonas sp.]|uniref:endonuclease/exonuclease/phosphatase family protein n=1 Tax=Thermaurantimonas sp. TaxID=2681568 RepID=UPI00391C37BC
MRKKHLIFFISLVVVAFNSYGQAARGELYRVMFYNVENLFDPYDDPEKNDNDFTPEGNYRWTEYRWREKTSKIAKVIRAVGAGQLPAIIGFCEIENRLVLEELARHPIIRDGKYQVVHYESPDRRGIDVGLFYRDGIFTLLYSEPLRVRVDNKPDFATRDILYVKGLLAGVDTVHIFVNHWPSRLGGASASEPNRIAAARTLRTKTDSIMAVVKSANVLIMGDFNDEPEDISLSKILGAGRKVDREVQLINLMLDMPAGEGSHRFQGRWGFLDQIIVSKPLMDGLGKLQVAEGRANVFKADFLLEDDNRYPGKMPYRQFIGFKFNGGFSDHLPVYIDVILKK